MEEGKRMFSIFAARMFEQRVLQAYREKVAQERQLQLLRELEDEDKMEKEKEAKTNVVQVDDLLTFRQFSKKTADDVIDASPSFFNDD